MVKFDKEGFIIRQKIHKKIKLNALNKYGDMWISSILVIEMTNNISGIYFLDRFRIFILGILYLFQGKEKLY